jgi:hypothetical protein
MSKLFNMKTIGMTAVSLSMLLGTLAAPASPAFAKAAFNKDRRAAGEVVTTGHRRSTLVFDGGRFLFRYLQTRNNLGNRTIRFR